MSKFQKGDKVQVVSVMFPSKNYTGTVRKAIAYSETRFKYNVRWDSIEGTMDGELKTEDQLKAA
jgi:hypothetical protein